MGEVEASPMTELVLNGCEQAQRGLSFLLCCPAALSYAAGCVRFI